MITQEKLKELFHYAPETGIFTRLTNRGGKKPGTPVGAKHAMGYIQISIDSKLFKAHRLAWLYHHGAPIPALIDHQDLDNSNNKISNLRAATKQQNEFNQPKPSNNTSGYKGVSWHSIKKQWRARTCLNGKEILFGYFDSPEEAYEVYKLKAPQIHGEFFRE